MIGPVFTAWPTTGPSAPPPSVLPAPPVPPAAPPAPSGDDPGTGAGANGGGFTPGGASAESAFAATVAPQTTEADAQSDAQQPPSGPQALIPSSISVGGEAESYIETLAQIEDSPVEAADKALRDALSAGDKLSNGAGVGDLGLSDMLSSIGSGEGPVPTDDVALKNDRIADIAEQERAQAQREAQETYEQAREAAAFQGEPIGVFA